MKLKATLERLNLPPGIWVDQLEGVGQIPEIWEDWKETELLIWIQCVRYMAISYVLCQCNYHEFGSWRLQTKQPADSNNLLPNFLFWMFMNPTQKKHKPSHLMYWCSLHFSSFCFSFRVDKLVFSLVDPISYWNHTNIGSSGGERCQIQDQTMVFIPKQKRKKIEKSRIIIIIFFFFDSQGAHEVQMRIVKIKLSSVSPVCRWAHEVQIRNEDICVKIGVAPIKEKMRENCLRWFGHVRRKPTDAPVQRVEHINLGQVKRAGGDRRKHGWR